jgi:hypothetical protein
LRGFSTGFGCDARPCPATCNQQLSVIISLTGRGALNEHWESRQGSGAKLWFLRNQGSKSRQASKCARRQREDNRLCTEAPQVACHDQAPTVPNKDSLYCGMPWHASKPPPTGPQNRCCGMPQHALTGGAWSYVSPRSSRYVECRQHNP